MVSGPYKVLFCWFLSALAAVGSFGSPSGNSSPKLLAEHLGWRCYSIEADGGGSDAVRVSVRDTAYSLGKYKGLFFPDDDGCPRCAEQLEAGTAVVVHVGERLAFYWAEYPNTKSLAALYVLRGGDLPVDVACPDEYRKAPLLLVFLNAVPWRLPGNERYFNYGRYIICPERNRCYDLDEGREELLFFPYRVADIPPSGYAPKIPSAPHREEFEGLLRSAEMCKVMHEADYPRLVSAPILDELRSLRDGCLLVRVAPRASYVTNCCAVVRKKVDVPREVVAVAEALENGLVTLCMYDERGRIRWNRGVFGGCGEIRASDRCSQFVGDGTVGFSCLRFAGEKYKAFEFRDQRAAAMADDASLRKTLLGVDENIRRLFGFEGGGELKIEQIRKGME